MIPMIIQLIISLHKWLFYRVLKNSNTLELIENKKITHESWNEKQIIFQYERLQRHKWYQEIMITHSSIFSALFIYCLVASHQTSGVFWRYQTILKKLRNSYLQPFKELHEHWEAAAQTTTSSSSRIKISDLLNLDSHKKTHSVCKSYLCVRQKLPENSILSVAAYPTP